MKFMIRHTQVVFAAQFTLYPTLPSYIYRFKKVGVGMTCLLFSESSPVVVCGGEDGKISVLRTYNIEREYDTIEEQLLRLDETIRGQTMEDRS